MKKTLVFCLTFFLGEYVHHEARGSKEWLRFCGLLFQREDLKKAADNLKYCIFDDTDLVLSKCAHCKPSLQRGDKNEEPVDTFMIRVNSGDKFFQHTCDEIYDFTMDLKVFFLSHILLKMTAYYVDNSIDFQKESMQSVNEFLANPLCNKKTLRENLEKFKPYIHSKEYRFLLHTNFTWIENAYPLLVLDILKVNLLSKDLWIFFQNSSLGENSFFLTDLPLVFAKKTENLQDMVIDKNIFCEFIEFYKEFQKKPPITKEKTWPTLLDLINDGPMATRKEISFFYENLKDLFCHLLTSVCTMANYDFSEFKKVPHSPKVELEDELQDNFQKDSLKTSELYAMEFIPLKIKKNFIAYRRKMFSEFHDFLNLIDMKNNLFSSKKNHHGKHHVFVAKKNHHGEHNFFSNMGVFVSILSYFLKDAEEFFYNLDDPRKQYGNFLYLYNGDGALPALLENVIKRDIAYRHKIHGLAFDKKYYTIYLQSILPSQFYPVVMHPMNRNIKRKTPFMVSL